MAIQFEGSRHYFQFVFAKQLATADGQHQFRYEPNRLEKIGVALARPVSGSLNKLLQNIRNPLVITALTIAWIAVVTIAFYPAQFVAGVSYVLPFVTSLKPWMAKATLFAVLQITGIGITLRALGRMNNIALVDAWNNRQIIPLPIGARDLD